jgi:universal stress protein A
MQIYRHILVAVDFFEHTQILIEKAVKLAAVHQAKMSLAHVVENTPLPDPGYGIDLSLEVDLTSSMITTAKGKLAELGANYGLPEDRLWVEVGSPKYDVNRIAEENQADLIVVGSHGRHGLALLLGSNVDGVVHHAKCDVLAIRLPDQ